MANQFHSIEFSSIPSTEPDIHMDRRFRPRTLLIVAALAFLAQAALFEMVPAQDQAPQLPPGKNAGAVPAEATAQDRRIARLIASLVPRYHISSSGLDDKISQRALDLYVERFD